MAFIIALLTSEVSIFVISIFITVTVETSQDGSCDAICEDLGTASTTNCRTQCLVNVSGACRDSWSINIPDHRMSILREGCFLGYSNLRILSMVNNIISNISLGAFQGCDSLSKIYLQNNRLEGVDEGVFEGAVSLTELYLSTNNISYLHRDALRGLRTLIYFTINENRVSQLSSTTFQHTPGLEYLHLSYNQLYSLPSGIFDGLSELSFLGLRNNKLTVIETGLFDALQNMEELNLSENLIVSITDFPTLQKLKTLNLYHNMIRQIGNLAEKVDGLDVLYLGKNNLTCTCTMDPIREWITNHPSDAKVEAGKVELICRGPPRLRGLNIINIPKVDLCRATQLSTMMIPKTMGSTASMHWIKYSPTKGKNSQGYGSTIHTDLITISIPTTTESTAKNAPVTRRNIRRVQPPRTGLSDVVIFVITGVTTLSVIVLALCIVVKCLHWQSHRYQQERGSGRPQSIQLQRPHQIPVMENGNQFHEDRIEDPYELVGEHSLIEDSWSQDSSNPSDQHRQTLNWCEPPYVIPNVHPDAPGVSALFIGRGPLPILPRAELTPLARQQQGTDSSPGEAVCQMMTPDYQNAPQTGDPSYMALDTPTPALHRFVPETANYDQEPIPGVSGTCLQTPESPARGNPQATPHQIQHSYMCIHALSANPRSPSPGDPTSNRS